MSNQRYRHTQSGPGLMVLLLFALPIGCLLVAGYFVFGGGGKKSNVHGLKNEQENLTANTTDKVEEKTAGGWRPSQPISLKASPTNDSTPTQKIIPKSAAPTVLAPPTSSEVPKVLSPFELLAAHPYYYSANDYFAFRQALLSEDYLNARITLNDLSLENDSAKQVLENLFTLWPTRFSLIADYCKITRVPLNLKDSLTGSLGKVITANKDGLTLENGVATQLIPWERIQRPEYNLLWQTMAQNNQATSEIRLIALFTHVLSQDYLTSRVLLQHMRTTLSPTDLSALQSLFVTIECWNIIRTAMDAHIARQNNDPNREEQCIATVSHLVSMGRHDWATTIVNDLSKQKLVAVTKATALDPLITINGLDRPATFTGNWSPDKKGTRCVGGGEVRIKNMADATTVEVTFTPVSYQGALRFQISSASFTIDLNRSMLEIKSAKATLPPIPIAVFPRYQNTLYLRFGQKDEPIQIRINHDQTLPTIAGIRELNEMVFSLSSSSDIRLHTFALK